MITIVFNGASSKAIELTGFNRSTTFENGNMNSMAYLNVVNTAQTAGWLQEFGLAGITNLTIKDGNDVIYNLANLNARISSVNESLSGNEISVSVNIEF